MKRRHLTIKTAIVVWLGVLGSLGLTGCLVAGYSSGGGFWIWPGSVLLTLILLGLFFMNRR